MDIMLARQPIFHKADRIAAYELFSRALGSEAAADSTPNDHTLVDVFLGTGVDAVTGGVPAFLTVSRQLLLGGSLELVNPNMLVVQLDAVEPDDVLVRSCEQMAAGGYRFALRNSRYSPALEPLLELGPFVKLDVQAGPDSVAHDIEEFRRFPTLLLAENVANRSIHDACVQLGFDFFQGLLFSRPETFTRQDFSVEHMRAFRLMRLVRDLSTSDADIEEEFRADVALSYKLLRMVNSAATGGRDIRSIGHALRMLGRGALYRWLGLLLLTPADAGGVDAEIAMATLLRARMCELVGDAGTRPLATGTLFMLGLLSALESYMGMPAELITQNLDLAPELDAALTSRRGPFGACLALVEAYENGRWNETDERAEEIGVEPDALPDLYLQALSWAEERARGTVGGGADEDAGERGAQVHALG